MLKDPTIIELGMDELEEILRRAEARQFSDSDYDTAKTVLRSYVHLVDLLKGKNISIGRLRKMLFGDSTEKTAAVVGGVSIMGGSGTILGAFLGVLLLNVIQNGLVFMRVSAYWFQAVQGGLILLAVVFDIVRKRRLGEL